MSSNISLLWTLLKNYNRTLIQEHPSNLNCDICNQLIIDAYQAKCGCKFCRACIETHIKDKRISCRGKGKMCKTTIINFLGDVQQHHGMNLDITALIARCPNGNCTFEDELQELPEHLKTCPKLPLECPFSRIGCPNIKVTRDAIDEHFRENAIQHSSKTIDFLKEIDEKSTHLNNEYEKNKIPQMTMDNNLKCVMDTMVKQKKTIQGLETQLGTANKEIDLLKTKVGTLTDELLAAVSEINSISSVFVDYQRKIDRRFSHLKENDQQFQTNILSLINNQRSDMDSLRQELVNIVALRKDVNTKLHLFQTRSLLIDHELTKQSYGDFIWIIDHFSDKRKEALAGRNEEILSASFYTHKNGYKMRLKIFPNGIQNAKGKYLGIYFYILKGDYDDVLCWPFMNVIKISIIDPATQQDYVKMEYSYETTPEQDKHVYHRQYVDDTGFGTINLVDMAVLMANGRLLKNDTLFVRCVVGQ